MVTPVEKDRGVDLRGGRQRFRLEQCVNVAEYEHVRVHVHHPRKLENTIHFESDDGVRTRQDVVMTYPLQDMCTL